ncbi:hypothetical protein V2J09_003490 [Rumex salicifolius]
MSFVAWDVAIVFGLAAAATYCNNWLVWPLYWLAQGTMFWALFVLGHDWWVDHCFCLFILEIFLCACANDLFCFINSFLVFGHGSFSNNPKLNSVAGHLLHSSILVPYHGWRISHRTHHQHHGHVENDESWHPLPERIYRSLESSTKKLSYTPYNLCYSYSSIINYLLNHNLDGSGVEVLESPVHILIQAVINLLQMREKMSSPLLLAGLQWLACFYVCQL